MAVQGLLTIGERNNFDQRLEKAARGELRAVSIRTLHVSIGLECNLACRHCHVESSPKRNERMTWETMQLALEVASRAGAKSLDITGGAPEIHPHFRRLVAKARNAVLDVMVRTNLTIMLTDSCKDLPGFFQEHGVQLVASLPCYLKENVERQRGKHVHAGSIAVLQRLNEVGYGLDNALTLDLVYNPLGPVLPPSQEDLEVTYRRELNERYGIRFTRLRTITNMPIGRFLHDLQRDHQDQAYERLLRDTFNPATVDGLMCRHQLHVGWDGTMYDCDFNFAIGTPVRSSAGVHIRNFDPDLVATRRIVTGDHCFGCTAGAGSSCAGEIV